MLRDLKKGWMFSCYFLHLSFFPFLYKVWVIQCILISLKRKMFSSLLTIQFGSKPDQGHVLVQSWKHALLRSLPPTWFSPRYENPWCHGRTPGGGVDLWNVVRGVNFWNDKFITGKRRREVGSAENKAKRHPSEASVGLFCPSET